MADPLHNQLRLINDPPPPDIVTLILSPNPQDVIIFCFYSPGLNYKTPQDTD